MRYHPDHAYLKASLDGLVDRTGRVEDILAILSEIYRERARLPEYVEMRDRMEQAARVMFEATEAVTRIFEGRANPKVDDLIQGLPATAQQLSAWLDGQDPGRSLESKVEAVLFHAFEGGAVDDLYGWIERVTDGGTEDDLAPALRRLLRKPRRRNPQTLPELVESILRERGEEHLLAHVLENLSGGGYADRETMQAVRRVLRHPRWLARHAR